MSRNGSGVYSLPAGQPVVTGTTISSATHNALMADIAAEITRSIASDGQTVPTANLPMGGFKLTGLAAGTGNGDSVRYEQFISGSGATGTWNISISGNAATATSATNALSTPTTGDRSLKLATTAMFTNEFTSSITANGYQKLPSGLIFQWGTYSVTCSLGPVSGYYYSNPTTFVFPISFPTACLIAIANPSDASGIEGPATFSSKAVNGASFIGHSTVSGAVITITVFAIGH